MASQYEGEKFGNLIEVVEIDDPAAIKDFYYEPLEHKPGAFSHALAVSQA